jgi:hypothetical protein
MNIRMAPPPQAKQALDLGVVEPEQGVKPTGSHQSKVASHSAMEVVVDGLQIGCAGWAPAMTSRQSKK